MPAEDNQELSDNEAEKLVAEADALYKESEASLTGMDTPAAAPDNEAKAAAPEKNTTVLYKKADEEETGEAFDRRTIQAKGGESLEVLIKGASVDPVQSNMVAEAVAKITKTKKLKAGEELRLALTPSSLEEGQLDVAKISLFYQNAHEVTLARSDGGLRAQRQAGSARIGCG